MMGRVRAIISLKGEQRYEKALQLVDGHAIVLFDSAFSLQFESTE